jgi:probable addiction module antidote protein
MAIKISKFDVSEYLNDEESIAAYLSAILEDGDPKLLLSAISDVAKARGMSKIASDSGLGRESLYKALNPEAKPRFETILKVLNSLGVKINFNAINEKDKKEIDRKYPKKTGKKIISARKRSNRTGSSRMKSSKLKSK